MIQYKIAHLLDDRSLGGVTRFLEIFDTPELSSLAKSNLLNVDLESRIAPKIDAHIIVTHFSANWRRIPFLFSLRMRNPQAKIIHIEHSYSPEWECLNVPNKRRFRLMLKTAYSIFDEIISVSKKQCNWLDEIGAKRRGNIRVIYPYALNPSLAKIAPAEFLDGETISIGAYGRYHESKGFDLLIAAFKALPDHADMRLVLGGYGEDDAKLRALVSGCQHIEVGGRVDDLAAFLMQCQVIAVPSRYEAFGMVATEAREAGRPIIVSNVGGLPEQVGRCGAVIDCVDPEMLTQSLLELRERPLQQMAIEAKRSMEGCRELRISQWQKLLVNHLCMTSTVSVNGTKAAAA